MDPGVCTPRATSWQVSTSQASASLLRANCFVRRSPAASVYAARHRTRLDGKILFVTVAIILPPDLYVPLLSRRSNRPRKPWGPSSNALREDEQYRKRWSA